MAGSEYTLALGLSRLGIPSSYITRVPDNPYGRALRNIARENGVSTDHFVWAPKTEPIGRLIYEIGRTPRKNTGVYQRMYSAASKLDSGMVDWRAALQHARLFHTSGITFGLSFHSNYERNYNLLDRLGGGDTWNAGFYYGLLTEGFNASGIAKGVLVGDAATRIKQTLMFDLPIIDKEEVHSLMKADVFGGGKRTSR